MPASFRADPSAPGLAGITEADLEALAEGRLSATELAVRLGVSRQAVSKALRKRRVGTGAHRAAPPGATPAVASKPAERIAVDAQELAASAAIALLVRAHGALASDQPLAPSALKSLSATVSAGTELLQTLGILSPEAEEPAALVIRVMSEAEERAIRAAAEAPEDQP